MSDKLLLKFNIYDKNMNKIDDFEFYVPDKYRDDKIVISEVNYNFLNDMILIVTEKEIYQVNVITKELITIYDLSLYKLGKTTDSKIFFTYDERKKKIEQIVLLIDKNSGIIYQFNWDNKMLLLTKQYEYKNIVSFIPLYEPNIFNDLGNKKYVYLEAMIVCSDKCILFNSKFKK